MKYLFLLPFIVFTFSSQAQNITVSAGINLNKIRLSNTGPQDYVINPYKSGASAGIQYETRHWKRYSIMLDVGWNLYRGFLSKDYTYLAGSGTKEFISHKNMLSVRLCPFNIYNVKENFVFGIGFEIDQLMSEHNSATFENGNSNVSVNESELSQSPTKTTAGLLFRAGGVWPLNERLSVSCNAYLCFNPYEETNAINYTSSIRHNLLFGLSRNLSVPGNATEKNIEP